MSTFLGTLASGEKVFDRRNSYFHKTVADLLPELFSKINSLNRLFIVEEIDLGRTIGESICVETTERDEIVYAVRVKRGGFTRFVRNRMPIPSSQAVVILKRDNEDEDFILITAFIGVNAPPEPWDKKPKPKPNSRIFWDTHALIMDGSYEIIPGTETTTCPWL